MTPTDQPPPVPNNSRPVCPICGGVVSRRGRTCRGCFFSQISFAEKWCSRCGVEFKPKSGVQINCDSCRFVCSICGGRKSNRGKPACRRCATKNTRRYNRTCALCGIQFQDRNNKSLYCDDCDLKVNPIVCLDCGVAITRGHQRCNACQAKRRASNPNRPPTGWRKYEHNGTRYRSKWEVEFAKILEICNVSFEYERRDVSTGTRPDFYIHALCRFIEIHPDYHGIKELIPENCVLVKTLSHARAMALAVALKVNPVAAKAHVKSLSTQAKRGFDKIIFSLAVFLRQTIEDEKSHQ